MLAGPYVCGGRMKLARGRQGDGGGEPRLLVVKRVPAAGLLLLLRRLPYPPCVLWGDKGELAVVSDNMCQVGGDAAFVVVPVHPSGGVGGLCWL